MLAQDRIGIAVLSIFIYAAAHEKLRRNRDPGIRTVAQVTGRVDFTRGAGYDARHRYLLA